MNRFALMNCQNKPFAVKYWDFADEDIAQVGRQSRKAVEECDKHGRGFEIWGFCDGQKQANWTYRVSVEADGERIPS